MTIKAKQIEKFLDGLIRINGFTANGANDVVTTVLSTALSTAGDTGVSVPAQTATATRVGVIVTGNNQVPLISGTTKKPFKDVQDNEIYARLTEASAVYTLTYYSLVNGTETAYSFASDTTIDFFVTYRFDFYRVPKDFAIAYTVADINQIILNATNNINIILEQLTVTAENTVSALSQTPSASNAVKLFVNGQAKFQPSFAVDLVTKAITWSAANAKFSLSVGDEVFAEYKVNA